jgi:hypothetical protein
MHLQTFSRDYSFNSSAIQRKSCFLTTGDFPYELKITNLILAQAKTLSAAFASDKASKADLISLKVRR